MTTIEKKLVVEGLVTKYTKSNEREGSVKKEQSDDNMTILKVQEMRDNADPLPADCGYENYEEWLEKLAKEAKVNINALANIEEQKVQVEALQYYIDNAEV